MELHVVVPLVAAAAVAVCTFGDGGASPNVAPVAAPAATLASWAPSDREVTRGGGAHTELRVLVAGDLLPHRPMLSEPSQIASALAPLHELFASADAVVANYETATGSVDAARERALVYGVDPAWMDAVAGSGVTALTLANNHACDLGADGLTATIDAARGNVVGLGADREDPWKARTIAEKNGRRVCAVAWTTFVNDAEGRCARSPALALAPLGRRGTERAAQAIRDARASGCDVTIAIAHGGLEYEPQARPMRAQAFAIAEAGADAVVLHHPHVPSPIVVAETSDGRRVPIFESIGNLVSNQGESWTTAYPPMQADHRIVYLNGWTRAGVVAELDIDVEGPRPALTFGYHVVWTDNDHVADRSNKTPRIAARILDPVADAAITGKLARDRALGPLLASPCWMEASRSICR